MKKNNISQKTIGIILMILTLAANEIMAQPAIRFRTKKFLNRTLLVIIAAKNELQKGKNYTGDFAKALAHQRFARKLFLEGFYQKAIYHSHRARLLAFEVIRSNKGVVQKDWELNKEETDFPSNRPTEQELDRALQKENPNLAFDDKAAAAAELKEIDIK